MEEMGYITLKEAEDLTGIKADTLKKRCQEGQLIGAVKRGNAWFVPRDEMVKLPHLQNDAVLRTLTTMAEAGMNFPITFLVKGICISGVMIGRREYYGGLKQELFKGIDAGNTQDLTGENTVQEFKDHLENYLFKEGESSKRQGSPRHVHLKHAALVQPGSKSIQVNSFYRIKISSIDGFSYGADEELYKGFLENA
jgi:hypothetical protein